MTAIKVIDLFAGPGGLGEGFSAFPKIGENKFRVVLSVEMDQAAHRTLTLRSVFRQFPRGTVPDAYYDFMRGNLGDTPESALYHDPEIKSAHAAAKNEAVRLKLGEAGKHRKVYKKIREALGKDECVLLGGPPCQAYSLIGRSKNFGDKTKNYNADEDERFFMYLEYVRILAKFQPLVFVMENVRGVLSAKRSGGAKIFDEIKAGLSNPVRSSGTKPDSGRANHSYQIFSFTVPHQCGIADAERRALQPQQYVIKSEDYGIPQARHRVILLGVREDLVTENLPVLTPKRQTTTVRDAISDLPPVRAKLTKEVDSPESWARIRKSMPRRILRRKKNIPEQLREHIRNMVEVEMPETTGREFGLQVNLRNLNPVLDWCSDHRLLGYVTNHATRGHMREDLERYWFTAAFGNAMGHTVSSYDFPEFLVPKHKNIKSGKFADRFRVHTWDYPAKTIMSHLSKDGHYYIHPDHHQMRSLTVREAARLQTFPDNYHFVGSPTAQRIQIGNAVPPMLAYQLAEVVYKIIAS